ncbi:unnamed protein product [Zymoseptoria tritici ST99CH_3D7]|uniref:Uncharacterized protein n=3 Tax=Zymoseptoria tritici TaxID=1047171 RepID=F9XLL8_ZYMTI|nr:uncharacterized protein MYCGRDRAFT_105901 [Zymoseptoria tritici IPO323]EGP83802.1 hypothetical protein MYCGRDRAFT_105901 [Zymoseptoria tritici IPO323]SMQ54604.1 unnamed protein product [Zymoseptoria tritici ST99CH_3D7]
MEDAVAEIENDAGNVKAMPEAQFEAESAPIKEEPMKDAPVVEEASDQTVEAAAIGTTDAVPEEIEGDKTEDSVVENPS